MKMNKQVVAVSVAFAGLIASGSAMSMPGFSKPAPDGSVRECVARIGEHANYDAAVRVHHFVETEERRVNGHTIMVDTKVFGADGQQLIREYATFCVVTDDAQTRKFKIREKS
jgi:hypothetical protein